jgi:hypothetical protein
VFILAHKNVDQTRLSSHVRELSPGLKIEATRYRILYSGRSPLAAPLGYYHSIACLLVHHIVRTLFAAKRNASSIDASDLARFHSGERLLQKGHIHFF